MPPAKGIFASDRLMWSVCEKRAYSSPKKILSSILSFPPPSAAPRRSCVGIGGISDEERRRWWLVRMVGAPAVAQEDERGVCSGAGGREGCWQQRGWRGSVGGGIGDEERRRPRLDRRRDASAAARTECRRQNGRRGWAVQLPSFSSPSALLSLGSWGWWIR